MRTAVVVNTATQADIEALVASVAGLFVEDAGQHDSLTDIHWPPREGTAYYSGLVSDHACLLLLARADDQVIGHLVGKITAPGATRTAPIAVLESMRVAPEARRTGVGSLLITHFLGWARECGARQASVTAYAANYAAQRFYERHGFAPQSITSRAAL